MGEEQSGPPTSHTSSITATRVEPVDNSWFGLPVVGDHYAPGNEPDVITLAGKCASCGPPEGPIIAITWELISFAWLLPWLVGK
jgi:hypothetical protein